MRLSVRAALQPFARALQRAYAEAIRGGAPKKRPDGRPTGGSLAGDVQRANLVRWAKAGFAFAPSRIGERFRWWWYGTERQPGRGRDVPVNEDQLVRALEEHLAKQIEAADGRTS
jgi:hypothetical protein